MAWQNEIVRVVRFLIDDIDCSTYTDDRLEETVIVAAQLSQLEIDYDTTYSIDVDELTISPDPTSPRDDSFINLVSMKAACIILSAEAKAATGQAVKVTDGPSTIDMTLVYKAKQERAKDVCDAYKQAVLQYQAGTRSVGEAIIGPYTQDDLLTPLPWNFS